MTAEASAGGTSLRAQADVFLTGRIAGFGRSLAGDVSRRMFEDFARAVDLAAAGEEPDVASSPASAVSILVAALADRARSALKQAAQQYRTARRRDARRRNSSRNER
jgi:carbon-monoxide dehydrogenase small subunit